MKTIPTILLALFVILQTQAQWQPTGISTNTIEGIYDVTSHNGTLFASVNANGFIKSTDDGASWQQVGQTGFATNPTSRRVTHIRSTDNDLYAVTFFANSASSMIYKSSDNGQTFVPDITGIPANGAEIVDVDYFYSHNNYLVAVVNSGNYIKTASAATWQKNENVNTKFAEHFAFYGTKFYAWGNNYHLGISVDNGQTWSVAADANLPQNFLANNLAANPDSGRLYVSGRSLFNFVHKLYYSDDEGANWVDMNIGGIIGNNWIGLGQTIKKIFAKGEYIQLSLDNNANNSVPDIFVSTDGGATFNPDTTGLPSSSGTTQAIAFTLHNDNLFMALNFIDIYKKEFETLGVTNADDVLGMNVYPNPSNGEFYIASNDNVNEIQVYGINGQLIDIIKNTSGIQNFYLQKKGLFILKMIDDYQNVTIKKVVRN